MRLQIEICGGALRHWKTFYRYDAMFGCMTKGFSVCFAGVFILATVKAS